MQMFDFWSVLDAKICCMAWNVLSVENLIVKPSQGSIEQVHPALAVAGKRSTSKSTRVVEVLAHIGQRWLASWQKLVAIAAIHQ